MSRLLCACTAAAATASASIAACSSLLATISAIRSGERIGAADDDDAVALALTGVGASEAETDDDPASSVTSSIPGNPSNLGLGFPLA